MVRGLLSIAAVIVACAAFAPGASAAVIKRVDGVTYVYEAETVRPDKVVTVRASCPKRTHVISGGFYQSGGYRVALGAHSFPFDGRDRRKVPDDGWGAQVRTFGQRVVAEAHAVCMRKAPAYVQRRVSVSAGGGATAYPVFCNPSSLSPVAGGSRGPVSVREVGGRFKLELDGWQTELVNDSGAEQEVTVYAVCSKLPVRYDQSTVDAMGGQQTKVTATCRADHPRVIGGGLSLGASAAARGFTAVVSSHPVAAAGTAGAWNSWVDNFNSEPVSMTGLAVCTPSPAG